LAVHEASEIFMALALFIGAALVFKYAKKRVAGLPDDQKSLGWPLYIIGLAVLTMAVASTMNYYDIVTEFVYDLRVLYFIVAAIAPALATIAALLILNYRKYVVLPFGLLVTATLLAIFHQQLGMSSGAMNAGVGMVTLILYLLPMALFVYLTATTRRATSLSIAFLLVTYTLFPLAGFEAFWPFSEIFLILRLLGPALIVAAYFMPNIGLTGEFFGYGLTFGIVVYYAANLMSATLDAALVFPMTMMAAVATVGMGTAAYTYGRWRISKNTATMTIFLYFFTAAFSYILVSLNHMYPGIGPELLYGSIIVGILAPMFLNLSAFVGLEWNKVLLLPLVIIAPVKSQSDSRVSALSWSDCCPQYLSTNGTLFSHLVEDEKG
jgi:hypothetical protein